MVLLTAMLPLLDVSPVGIWLPIIGVALFIAVPILLIVFFLVRSLRRQLQARRDRDR